MLSANFYLVLILIFYLLLCTALWLSLYTVSRLLHLGIPRVFRLAVVLTAVVMGLFVYARFDHPELYRLILNYMGLLNFGFFIASLIWLPALAYRALRGSWPALGEAAERGLGIAYVLCVVVVTGLASYNFHKPETVVEFEIVSDKLSQPVRFAHISDIQYGTISSEEMTAKLQRVYALEPEFIVFTGDLIDFEGYSTEDFAVLAESPVPILFERGNHEFYHDPSRLLADLNRIDTLQLLINQRADLGALGLGEQLDIIGIDFGQDKGHLANKLEALPLVDERFSILLYHEPIDIDVAKAHGFDLMLYGHTHAGQIWPFTWMIELLYDYADGLYQDDSSTVYTSDGIALWGPRMRLDSQNEIVLITLRPDAS